MLHRSKRQQPVRNEPGTMQEQPRLTLYYAPSACSQAAHIALEESGLAFEGVRIDLGDPMSRTSYQNVNPGGKVPALLIDGALLTESIAILTYIAALAPSLMPDGALARARCLSKLAWFAATAHIAFRQTRRPERFAAAPAAHAAVVETGHVAFRAALGAIDAGLADAPWMAGDQFTVADGYGLVMFGWGMSNGYDMTAYPAFEAFRRRAIARPAVRRVLEREQSIVLSAPS
jgi:glutathione S-transferase